MHDRIAVTETAPSGISPAITFACALACGAMVANIYYAQPLIGLIAPELHMAPGAAGLIVTLTQLGYAAGLLFIVPLADRLENRRLILATLVLTAAALVMLALVPSASAFLVASAFVGVASAGVHMVIPFAASLAPAETRGRTIGNVMSGLLAGIMLSRPVASIIAEIAGWRAVFGVAAALMLLLALWLARVLPERRPTSGESYGRILRSMVQLLLRERALQRRSIYHGFVFTIFTIFWTAVPLELAGRFGFSQTGIAGFALAGAAGALVAPIAGRLGDRGHIRAGTGAAMLIMIASCLLAGWAAAAGSLVGLVLFAIGLDGATQLNQVLGQRVIFSLPGEDRGRVNAVYMTIIFLFGSTGGIVASIVYHAGGWRGTMLLSAAMGVVVLAIFATEFVGRRRAGD
jgi:predicted MFS family arabinose efflux permease